MCYIKWFTYILYLKNLKIFLWKKDAFGCAGICISKFPPYLCKASKQLECRVISVYQEKFNFRISNTHYINCYSLETISLMTGNYFRRWKRSPWNMEFYFEDVPKCEVKSGSTLAQHRQNCCRRSVANIRPLPEW